MPFRFQPLNSGTTMANLVAQLNRNFSALDGEAVTKVFRSENVEMIQGIVDSSRFGTLMRVDGVDRIFTGLYMDGRFGTLRYDENGVPIFLDGMAPDDGRDGTWRVPVGRNVLTELGV